MPSMGVYLSNKEYAQLLELAKKKNMGVGVLARFYIQKGMAGGEPC